MLTNAFNIMLVLLQNRTLLVSHEWFIVPFPSTKYPSYYLGHTTTTNQTS